MSLLNKISNRILGKNKSNAATEAVKDATLRRCYFEVMEERRVLSADPVIAGVTYLEGDEGQDAEPDYFEVTFEGGAETTQLTQFVINGDQDLSGTANDGDMIFHTAAGLPGTSAHHGFQFDASNSSGVTASDIRGVSISADATQLTVDVDNFEAGDVFAFTIDVDEIERLRVDEIASGVEFEGSLFSTTFIDENYTFEEKSLSVVAVLSDGFVQPQSEGIFFDEYNELIGSTASVSGSELELSLDNELGEANRTAASVDAFDLVEKPISISGTVYHDEDADCVHDADEDGISGVTIELQQRNSAGQFVTVATTQTDAQGNYEFGTDLNLKPGDYQLVEIQPDGYLDVGADAGTLEGQQVGQVTQDSAGDKNVIGDISIPLGGTSATNYDFKEVRPASISGNVFHDENNDGVFDPNEQGIANVLIEITRVGAKDGVAEDAFAGMDPIFVRTDANGHYSVESLPPGIYEVVEINNYPANADPLAPYIDGIDSVGNVAGTNVGAGSNDRVTQIELCADDDGVEYNFGEILPASISGYVSVDSGLGGSKLSPSDPNFQPIAGVTLQLLDETGSLLGTTQTDANGRYEFDGLAPGTYSVVEVQPNGYIDGGDVLGEVDGQRSGAVSNDRFDGITLGSGDEGVQYNFCEFEPASISGYVSVDTPGSSKLSPDDPDFQPIEGVTLELLDDSGAVIGTTTTDANGRYEFNELPPGTYSVRELQPEGYLDGGDVVGTVDGSRTGSAVDDQFNGITVGSGDVAENYNFCEHEPASLKGTVYYDRNDNGRQDAGEEGIENVVIELLDADGNLVASTTTDANGDYCFEDLLAGEYMIRQIQPTDYVDGQDQLGEVNTPGASIADNGFAENDKFNGIVLDGGDEGTNYDFGEIRLASINGTVHADANGDCVFDPEDGDTPLEGVELVLLDSSGNEIARTTTDENGDYSFGNLRPGTYSVREITPDGFFDSGEKAGTNRGIVSDDLISSITVGAEEVATGYDFCEEAPAEIHGRVWEDGPAFETEDGNVPDDYRNQRDGIYQANVDTPIEGVRMQLYYYFDPNSKQIEPRAVTLGEVLPEFYAHMGTADLNAPVWVETMDNGEYWFQGLQAGNYIVLESQPDGYVDANDTPGTSDNETQALTFNSDGDVNSAIAPLTRAFSGDQLQDAVANIRVNAGGISVQNNFSEVRAIQVEVPDGPVIPGTGPTTPRVPGNPNTPSPGLTGLPGLAGSQPSAFTAFIGTSRGAQFQTRAEPTTDPYTWHLSVVNGGLPRAAGTEAGTENSVWQQAGYISNQDWSRYDMDDAIWSFTRTDGDEIVRAGNSMTFGMIGGTPLAGDFDGDGIDEVAVYKDGYWMIDINRNGRWDETDLLAKLGDTEDRPVVGDWDGDGKDDIGIYGPMWERDPEAIDQEPGLPNPENDPYTRPKNIPPTDDDATNGARIMKLTSYGRQRADVVDHVFGIGEEEEIPVTGDWNGNGIRSIGTFTNGEWQLDVNGDGEFDYNDKTARFGRAGDTPVVGDFNGDGIEEIAVYRNGKWIIDSNGNLEIDATDKTFEMGGALDKPVVGDWDGDGVDEPGLYTEQSSETRFN